MTLLAQLRLGAEQVVECPALLEGKISVHQLADRWCRHDRPGIEPTTSLHPPEIESRHGIIAAGDQILATAVPDHDVSGGNASLDKAVDDGLGNGGVSPPDGTGLGRDLDADTIPRMDQGAPCGGDIGLPRHAADHGGHHARHHLGPRGHPRPQRTGVQHVAHEGRGGVGARRGKFGPDLDRRNGLNQTECRQQQRPHQPAPAPHAGSPGFSRSMTGCTPSLR